MGKLNKNDFVSVEYTGRIKETGHVFDTTNEDVAKKENIHNSNMTYGPVNICIGQNQVLPGIDEALLTKEENKSFTLDVEAEKAFGKKSAKLLKLVPSSIFKKQGIQPFVGLEVQIDNTPGIIRTLSGGRILVDFNHPLSGKDLNYEVKVNKKVTDTKQKLVSYLSLTMGAKDPKISFKEGKAVIEMQIPPQVSTAIADKIKELIPEIKTVEFVIKDIKNVKK